jgi:hypothetical protein
MKKRMFIIGAVVAILVLVMIVSACGPTAPSTSPPAAAKETFKVLNPAGVYVPVQTVGLAARIDSLAGKSILYYQSEANPVMMPVLLDRLKKAYPTSTFKVLLTEAYGLSTPGDEATGMQTMIRGVSW